jgi:lysophospholipase L1-like esterase
MVMRTRAAALLAVCVIALAGCGDDSADDPGADGSPSSGSSSSTSPSPSASSSEGADAGTTAYVALGDSYTAAPLVPESDPADPCLRSSNNYPKLVARAMPELALTDVSCAGADSAAMIGVQKVGSEANPAQFDSLTTDTDLVTIGLGGNDFGIFGTLLRDCASSSSTDAAGKPCTDAATNGVTQDLTTVVPQIEARLTAVVKGVEARSPDARVVLVGYPRLLPDQGTCEQTGIAKGDYAYVRGLIKDLDDQIQAAATATGADYIDMYAASEGHDICSADPWVNGRTTDPAAALAYHPFAAEQQAVADLVVQALQG